MAKTLAERFKERRLAMNISQTKMAVLADISLGTVVKIEAGTPISDLTIAKVERFLKASKKEQAA